MRYTEPLVVAALAAPPCYEGPEGQYLENCATVLGNTIERTEGSQGTLGYSVGVKVGYGFEDRTFTQSAAEATAQLKLSTAYATQHLQELSVRREHTNGTASDMVLVRVLGFEQFAYEILSAPPGADGVSRVGERLYVYVPRGTAHTTRMVPMSLVRPALRPSQVEALEAVFVHTPTDPTSYMRRVEVANTMQSLGVSGVGCDEGTVSFPTHGLESCGYFTVQTANSTPSAEGPVSGEGNGEFSEIAYSNQKSTTETWGIESTLDLELSAGGVIFGLEVGRQSTSDVFAGHGSTVSYGVSYGGIDELVYESYRAGVLGFSYPFDCDEQGACQEIEVVTAWVEMD